MTKNGTPVDNQSISLTIDLSKMTAERAIGVMIPPQNRSIRREFRMLESRRFRRYTVTAVLFAAGIAAIFTSHAQSPSGKWWPGYGNGADNSRYFASKQINKSNVNQLQVAWNYPFGDTSFGPDCGTGCDLWAWTKWIARRGRREDRQGAVDSREHEWHDEPRHELLGKHRRPRSASDLRDEQPAPGTRCEDGQVDHDIRSERLRGSAHRP